VGAKYKNILLIIPELCVGGAQRSLANLSIELAHDFNVWLVVFNKDQLAPYKLGGELLSLDVFSGNSWFTKVNAFFKRVANLKRIKKNLNIDVSVSFLEGADYVNILSAKNDKVVISIRGSKYFDEEINGPLGVLRLKILMPILYHFADKVVCVSHGIKDELQQRMHIAAEKLVVIHNFYDRDQFFSNIKTDPKTDEIFSSLFKYDFLLSVGRLHRQKNFERLLDVFARVAIKTKDLKLVIIGDGNEKENLLKRARHLNLAVHQNGDAWQPEKCQVFFTGFQKPGSFLKHAKIFILPSLWEGFPNALIEALAFGVPVMAADCHTGPREILAPNTSCVLTDNAEYTQTGVLLPVLNSSQRVEVWAAEVMELLANQAQLGSYKISGPLRFRQFDRTVIYPEWCNLLLLLTAESTNRP
jgi:glycosyltransferase involved in cell wall biosynthesis